MVELLASRHAGATESNGYVRVLSDALAGDRTLFAREDYVEEAWRIVDPVVKASTALYTYEPGSWGPAEAAHVAPPRGVAGSKARDLEWGSVQRSRITRSEPVWALAPWPVHSITKSMKARIFRGR